MGNCTIVVHADGVHHNKDNPSDIDRMAADFVGALRRAGHIVEHASLTHSGRDNLLARLSTAQLLPPLPGDA